MHRNVPEPLCGDHHTTVAHPCIQIGFATSRNPATWQCCLVPLRGERVRVRQRLQKKNIENRLINSIPRYTFIYAAIPQRLAVRWRGPARLRWCQCRAESRLWVVRDIARRLWTKCGQSHIDNAPGLGQTDH